MASIFSAFSSALLWLMAINAPAQTPYTDRPIRMIVNGLAGSHTDTVVRFVAQKLTLALGKSVMPIATRLVLVHHCVIR